MKQLILFLNVIKGVPRLMKTFAAVTNCNKINAGGYVNIVNVETELDKSSLSSSGEGTGVFEINERV